MENQQKHYIAKQEVLMLFDNLLEINENVEEDAYEEAKRILQRRRMRKSKNKNHK
jgi:hypothetical protein